MNNDREQLKRLSEMWDSEDFPSPEFYRSLNDYLGYDAQNDDGFEFLDNPAW